MISKLSRTQLQSYIRRIAVESSRLAFTEHALQQMNRRHITREMAAEVVRMGVLKRTPEPNHSKGSLECRMERYVAGRDLGVVVAVSDEEPNLIIVTAMVL